MGYSVYWHEKNARWQGYGVIALCDHPGCKTEIDRGMSYTCCDDPTHQNSCGGFFCSEHQHIPEILDESDFEDMDEEEKQEYLEQLGLTEPPLFDEDGRYHHVEHGSIESKESKAWLEHVLTDSTWEKWRTENLKLASQYQVMLNDLKGKYVKLARLVREAIAKGHEAAAKSDDGGSANMDAVILCGLKGVRASALVKAGIPCSKKSGSPGSFWLHCSFNGMGNKRNAGVEATKAYLKEHGIDCYIHYQID